MCGKYDQELIFLQLWRGWADLFGFHLGGGWGGTGGGEGEKNMVVLKS